MAADLLRQPTTQARARLVLLHGWGADAGDLMPLGQALAKAIATPLELVALPAPQLQTQGSGRQWYGLFPADWAAVPAAVEALKEAGANIKGMAAIFTYGFDISVEKIKEANIDVFTLSNYDNLLDLAVAKEYITENEQDLLKEWRKNPAEWSVEV